MGIFRDWFTALFGLHNLDADPLQQELAEALVRFVNGHGGPIASGRLETILTTNGWSRSEQRNRLAHAASMVKVWRADLYPQVREVVHTLMMASHNG
jgi:hypothetical protein